MDKEIRNLYQVDSKQMSELAEHNLETNQKIQILTSNNTLQNSKNQINFQENERSFNLNDRSQSRNSVKNFFVQTQNLLADQKEPSWPLKQNLQIRKSVSSKVIRMTTSQFSKRQQLMSSQQRLQSSDSKNAYQLINSPSLQRQFQKYCVTSRKGSITQIPQQSEQAPTSFNNSKRQLVLSQNIEKNQPQDQLPMSLQYKMFQESYFQSSKNASQIQNFSQINSSTPRCVNSTFNSNFLSNQKSSNLLQKYFTSQSSNVSNMNKLFGVSSKEENNLCFNDQEDISTANLASSTLEHIQNSSKSNMSQSKLNIFVKQTQSMQNQSYFSPKASAVNTTANTYLTKMSFPSSPKQNFFITENPSENLNIMIEKQYSIQDQVNSDQEEQFNFINKQDNNKASSIKSKEKLPFLKKNIETFSRGSLFHSPVLQSQTSDKARFSLQQQFQLDQIQLLQEKIQDDKLSFCQNDKQSQITQSENGEQDDLMSQDIQKDQNIDDKSDISLSFKQKSLLQNTKDKLYYEQLMSPLSSKSEIQQERLHKKKPSMKFYQKLKRIDKITQENEFDRVKIRNIDLETAVIQKQLKNAVLPINLKKCYKENVIPNKNIKQKTELNTHNEVAADQSDQQPSQGIQSQQETQLNAEKNAIEVDLGQKRVNGVNYQGLQDEEKIKEMEEFLESDKYNETFYANNLKMGKSYIDIISSILQQKKARRSLKQVFIKNNRINNESLAKIVQNLPLSTKQLDISCNQINHIGSKYVTELIQDNAFHNLEYLNVSKNMIGDIGAIKIFEAAVSNNFLKVLDLSHNRITNLCNNNIQKLLQHNQYLDELYLGHNTLMNESLKSICDGLVNNYNLKVLDLQNNSLGGSKEPQKFYGKRLIRICNNKQSNMKHLDLSFNRFQKSEAVEIAVELQDNFYLYGLHFEGNPCNYIINARGFLVENKIPLDDQGRGFLERNIRINGFQNVSEIYKDYYYKTINNKQIQSTRNNQLKAKTQTKKSEEGYGKSGEICWICDGYKEVKFTFKLNYKIDREPVYIHLSFEDYEPFRMDQDPIDNSKFFIYRMCPPDEQITYFFSNPFINQISILPYNQIRSSSNPMNKSNASNNNNKRPSMRANQMFNLKTECQKQNQNVLTVNYTDIQNYIIPLPYLMNIYKQNNNDQDHKNLLISIDYSKKLDQNGNEYIESAEDLIKQISQQAEMKKEEYKTHINRDDFDKNPGGQIIYIYKKKLSNVLNENYDPIIRSIIRQIQKPFLGQSEQSKGWKKNGWDVKNSIFAEYKSDDYLHLKNCFEFDWAQSKLNKMVRSEDDKEDLKQVLYDIYPFLKNTYKQLACQNIYGEVFAVSSSLFQDLISQTKISDGKIIKSSDIEFNFIATNAQKEKHPRNPDKALIRFQFMEVLVRLAFDKYIKNKTFSSFSEAFKQILNEEDLLKVLMASNDPQKWRENRLWTTQCDTLIKNNMEFFKKIYEKFAGSRNKEKRLFTNVKVMCCQEFKDFIFSYPIFSELTNERELNQFFNDSIMTQVDELNKDRHMQMQLIEFVEAFGRISDKLSPVPYGEDKDAYTKQELMQLPLHMKIESIIAQINGLKGGLIPQKQPSRQSFLNIPQTSMPKINSQIVLDQKSIEEIKDDDSALINNSAQIKLGFKGFMLAKSLKKRLIENKQNSIQPHQGKQGSIQDLEM
ncbi:hypothetical protein ABPG72_017040 [Tetrahymena utriculariae]